jgi:hypothetical protein
VPTSAVHSGLIIYVASLLFLTTAVELNVQTTVGSNNARQCFVQILISALRNCFSNQPGKMCCFSTNISSISIATIYLLSVVESMLIMLMDESHNESAPVGTRYGAAHRTWSNV